MVLFFRWTLLYGVYHPYGLVFYHQLCNRSPLIYYFHVCCCDRFGFAYSPICFQSAMNGMSKSMSRPNIAAPGEAFNTVWYVEWLAHSALLMNVSMSAEWTESAMSNSEVHIIVPKKTWCLRSQMSFACGFLILDGLRFMPFESHNVSKCNLNSDPLSYIKYRHCRYLNNQILSTNRLIWSDDLSKISSLITFSLPLTVLVINRVIVGNSTTSNQLEAGLIMVRAMKSIDDPPMPLSVYRPTRSTHKASHGVLITILVGRCPNFRVPF